MVRIVIAASLAAAFATPALATPQLPCGTSAPREARPCDGPRCATAHNICRPAATAPRTPRLEETSFSVQERGRRELDALIAGLN